MMMPINVMNHSRVQTCDQIPDSTMDPRPGQKQAISHSRRRATNLPYGRFVPGFFFSCYPVREGVEMEVDDMQKVHGPADLITLQEARRMLGVSADTLERRIAAEGLSKFRSPFDRRVRLLDRCEVESLLTFEIVHPRERVA